MDLIKMFNPEYAYNYITVYKDNLNAMWYIQDKELGLLKIPFGLLSADFINQIYFADKRNKSSYKQYNEHIHETLQYLLKHKTIDKNLARFTISDLNLHLLSDPLPNNTIDTESIITYLSKASIILSSSFKAEQKLNGKSKYTIDAAYNNICYFSYKFWLHTLDCQTAKYIEITNNDKNLILYLNPYIYCTSSQTEQIKSYAYRISLLHTITAQTLLYNSFQNINIEDNTILCDIFKVPSILILIPEDFAVMQTIYAKYKFKRCTECSAIFLSKHNNQRFCPYCSYNNSAHRSELRKKNDCRWLHKHIYDNLYYKFSKDAAKQFAVNSNYYWAVVNGRTPKKSKLIYYKQSIKTKEAYYHWLEACDLKYNWYKNPYYRKYLKSADDVMHAILPENS